jgi:hypothetical protein
MDRGSGPPSSRVACRRPSGGLGRQQLDTPDGVAKLHGHKSEEVGEGGEGVGFLAQWKSQ